MQCHVVQEFILCGMKWKIVRGIANRKPVVGGGGAGKIMFILKEVKIK